MNSIVSIFFSHLSSEYNIKIRYKENQYREFISINEFWKCFDRGVDIIELVNKKTSESVDITLIRDMIVKSVLLITEF